MIVVETAIMEEEMMHPQMAVMVVVMATRQRQTTPPKTSKGWSVVRKTNRLPGYQGKIKKDPFRLYVLL